MKIVKFILVFLVFAGVASCSNDDDGNSNETPANDPIIGTWKIQQLVMNGEQIPIGECEAQTRVEFRANGTVRTTDVYEDFDTEECVTEVYTEQWQKLSNNVYRITDEVSSNDVTINFSNNNNTFTISAEDEDGSYSATYVRV